MAYPLPLFALAASVVTAVAATVAAASAPVAIRPADMVAKTRVEVDYALHCQGCHLPDGRGIAGKVPDLRASLGRFLEVPGGRAYIMQVPGVATSRLDNDGTARLLNWLVVEMGAPASCKPAPFTAAEVGALRANWLRTARPVRERLMQQIGALPIPQARARRPTCPT
ncbi:mono/diheme cytochrome c family protein [Novosphingobium hassiacum]|uniref:Mono/diheme cytochrome c family protein n=1 Tax=Novosphingobium hassiacum TaxID=173676 RepID=A0A7W6EWI1_9SPHN|nr:hypothetical protein [Novosphingobium hassiacum]MBB3861303.1 mono/diheme cytochrome c family protein [Novosphingobium hassiacum]